MDETKPLLAGTKLIFRVKSEASFRNKTLKRLVKVGSGHYLNDDSRSRGPP